VWLKREVLQFRRFAATRHATGARKHGLGRLYFLNEKLAVQERGPTPRKLKCKRERVPADGVRKKKINPRPDLLSIVYSALDSGGLPEMGSVAAPRKWKSGRHA